MLDNVLQTPPGDLASLLAPKIALKVLKTPTDEDSLLILAAGSTRLTAVVKAIAELGADDFATRSNARKTLLAAGTLARQALVEAANSDDPEIRLTAQELLRKLPPAQKGGSKVDMDYVRQLYAIRVLGELKSQKAVPILTAAAKDAEPTIRQAALSALAAIHGEQHARPEARKLLASTALRLPEDLALVAMLDLTSGAKPIRLHEIFGAMNLTVSKMDESPLAHMVLETIATSDEESPEVLLDVLATVGNLRVDAVTMIISNNWPFESNEQQGVYIAWIVQGLCAPKRLELQCGRFFQWRAKRALRGGQAILTNRSGLSMCVIDESTVVLGIAPNRSARYMDIIVAGLAAEKQRTAPPALAAKALALMEPKDTRLAVAATPNTLFAPKSLVMLRKDVINETTLLRGRIGPDSSPRSKMSLAVYELMSPTMDVKSITGSVDVKGAVELKVQCAGAAAARTFGAALKHLRSTLDPYVAAKLKHVAPIEAVKAETEWKGNWWKSKIDDNVTITGALRALPRFLTMHRAVYNRAERTWGNLHEIGITDHDRMQQWLRQHE